MKKLLFALLLLSGVLAHSPLIGATLVVDYDVSYVLSSNYLASTNIAGTADQANGVWLGNLRNQENWRDLIIANRADNTVSIRLCNDNGTFKALTNYTVGLNPVAVRSLDLTGDGAEDIIVANSGTNTVSILTNSGFGTSFTGPSDYIVGTTLNPSPVFLAVGDINADAHIDIITANSAEDTVTVLTNTVGSYATCTNIPVGDNPQSVQLVDLDGDILKDLLVANRGDGTLTILLQELDGTLGPAQTITLFSGGDPQPMQASAQYLNGDSLLDIAVVNYASNTVSILTNFAGTFTIATNIPVGTGPRSLVFRDFNADGEMDIAVANSGSGTVTVLLNNGDGTFDASNSFAVGSNPVSIAGSNFNGDGMNDMAVANQADNTISILLYDLPMIYSDSKAGLEDQTNTLTFQSRIFSGRTATYTIIDSPTNGVLSGSGATRYYVPDTNYYGPDSFTFFVNDGVHSSLTATFDLVVVPVNDQPTFSLAITSVTVDKYGVINSVPGVIATTSPGPANESDQTITFVVTTTNANQFSGKPAISPAGTLSYKPSFTASGTTILTVRAKDTGGISGGGTNLSPPLTISVTIPAIPYPAIKGFYRGLFYENAGVTHDTSGYFQMKVGNYGEYTGKINTADASYGFSGYFNAAGVSQTNISRGLLSPLTLNMVIDLNAGGTEQVLGTLTDGVWTANVEADRATFDANLNPAPQAGSYTMLFPGSNDPTTSPSGESFARVTVLSNGVVRAVGALADGRSFSHTSAISKTGQWPFYLSLYGYKGSVLSWITFVDQFDTSFSGNLSWIKTGAALIGYYPAGFTNDLVVSGSTFTPAAPGTRLVSITNGLTRLDGGNLAMPLVNSVTIDTSNKVTVVNGAATNLAVTIFTNGLVSGKFKHPGSGKLTAFKGAVFQEQTTIGGFFLGTNQGGVFLLESND